MFRSIIIAAAVAGAAGQAAAEDGWTGEGAVSGAVTSGNTETFDVGVALTASRDLGLWTHTYQAAYDYGQADVAIVDPVTQAVNETVRTNKDRLFVSYQLDRQITDRLFAFGQQTVEMNEFAGFDSRHFLGAGVGYDVIAGEQTHWTVRGGAGYKREQFGDGSDAEGAAALASSTFGHAFNDAVSVSNETSAIAAEETTQLGNIAALNAKLNGKLTSRFSVEVRHDTNPPEGFEETDTATKASLVLGF